MSLDGPMDLVLMNPSEKFSRTSSNDHGTVTGESKATSQLEHKLSGNKCLKYSSQKFLCLCREKKKIYALSLCKHKMLKKENLKSLLGVLSALISAFFYTMDGILVKKVDSLGRCRLFYEQLVRKN